VNYTRSKPDLATLSEIAGETGVSLNWLYKRTMMDSLPGLRRLGRNVRIDRQVFYDALEKGHVD